MGEMMIPITWRFEEISWYQRILTMAVLVKVGNRDWKLSQIIVGPENEVYEALRILVE